MPAINWCEIVKEKLQAPIQDVKPLFIPFTATLEPYQSKTLDYSFPPNYAYSLEGLTFKGDGDFKIAIKDVGSSDWLMPEPVSVDLIAGIGMMPFWLPCPYLLLPSAGIEILLQDVSGAQNNVEVVLLGYKLIV